MSLREDMEKATKEVVEEGHVEDAKFVAFVKDRFRKTLENCEKTKTSVKSATIEILKGIEDGLKAAGLESKELLLKAASGMLEITKEVGEKGISAARHAADASKAVLDAELEKVHGSIDHVKQKTKDDMKIAYGKLLKNIEIEKERLNQIGEAFKDYSKEKSHTALGKVAEKSKKVINNIEQSAKEYGGKLLHHSQDKVANWLRKMRIK